LKHWMLLSISLAMCSVSSCLALAVIFLFALFRSFLIVFVLIVFVGDLSIFAAALISLQVLADGLLVPFFHIRCMVFCISLLAVVNPLSAGSFR